MVIKSYKFFEFLSFWVENMCSCIKYFLFSNLEHHFFGVLPLMNINIRKTWSCKLLNLVFLFGWFKPYVRVGMKFCVIMAWNVCHKRPLVLKWCFY